MTHLRVTNAFSYEWTNRHRYTAERQRYHHRGKSKCEKPVRRAWAILSHTPACLSSESCHTVTSNWSRKKINQSIKTRCLLYGWKHTVWHQWMSSDVPTHLLSGSSLSSHPGSPHLGCAAVAAVNMYTLLEGSQIWQRERQGSSLLWRTGELYVNPCYAETKLMKNKQEILFKTQKNNLFISV